LLIIARTSGVDRWRGALMEVSRDRFNRSADTVV